MEPVKGNGAPAQEDDPVFFILRLRKDGGMEYELNMAASPDKHSSLSRAVGNATITLWQITEWATALIRSSMAARQAAEAQMITILEQLKDDGPVN